MALDVNSSPRQLFILESGSILCLVSVVSQATSLAMLCFLVGVWLAKETLLSPFSIIQREISVIC